MESATEARSTEDLRVIADFHIHGRYSRATSERMIVAEISKFAKLKGVTLVGTGDFTHPLWLKELRERLVPALDEGLYVKKVGSPTRFMITGEINTIFSSKSVVKKVHHLIFTPSFETAIQINDRLSKLGDLSIDGRPTLDVGAPQLVEEIMEVSCDNMVIPAHVWTPWFSVFGAFSGFDSIRDCYLDTVKHISAVETGLSSDPPMNWRLSMLDGYTLISNSDCHSPWPWRIGREANVFEVEKLSYLEIIDVIRRKDVNRFMFTVETYPDYGKYHWTGHRKCGVSLPPEEAIKLGNRCPRCKGKLTKGVEQRVDELADRPIGFKPENAVNYKHLLPLSEIIATVYDVSSPYAKKVWDVYNVLVRAFNDEYTVLLDTSLEKLAKFVEPEVAKAIVSVRKGKIRVIPGYDGVYGQLSLVDERSCKEEASEQYSSRVEKQRNLMEYV